MLSLFQQQPRGEVAWLESDLKERVSERRHAREEKNVGLTPYLRLISSRELYEFRYPRANRHCPRSVVSAANPSF